MYSLTLCVRVMLPDRHQWKSAVQAAAVMLRAPPPSPAGHRPAARAHPAQRSHYVVISRDGRKLATIGFALCCHSNATRAPIAHPPSSARLGGNLYHALSYIRVHAVVWAYGRGQTDRQTDTQTRVTTIHFASSTTHAKCNKCYF